MIEGRENRLLFCAGDGLVGGGGSLRQYTLAGTKVKQIDVPSGGADGGARDFQVDPNGNLQLWAGTFSPVLEAHQGPITGGGGWTTEASTLFTPGWSTINRTFNGGVAV